MNKAQRATMLQIIADINDESIRSQADLPEDMPAWFLDWPLFSAGENMAGCMPDSPYVLFYTERAARGYCRELESTQGGTDYVSDIIPTCLRETLSAV
jgi:hypothetical protein